MEKVIKYAKIAIRYISIFLFVFVIGYTARYCTERYNCPGKGNVIVSQAFLDSLEIVANQPPDTVIKEVITKGKPVYVDRPVPTPVEVEPDLKLYSDSIVNDSINIFDDIWVRGTIERWERRYQTVYKETIKEITISKPVPIKYEVPAPQRGLYGAAGLGYELNYKNPLLSGELIYLTKKGKFIGIQTFIGKDATAIVIKYGIKIL